MENVISLLEGEVFKFKLNIERHKKNKLKHIAQYYEELKLEYEKAIEVLKISSNVPVIRCCHCKTIINEGDYCTYDCQLRHNGFGGSF